MMKTGDLSLSFSFYKKTDTIIFCNQILFNHKSKIQRSQKLQKCLF